MRKVFVLLFMMILAGQVNAQSSDTIVFKDANGKYGIKIKSNDKVLVEPIYRSLEEPSEGLYLARTNENTGFIDSKGKTVVPFKYNDANNFSEGLAAVNQETKSGWKIGFVDKNGKLVIDLKYHSMYLDRTRFINGIAVVAKGDKEYGIIDRNGRELTPFIYTGIEPFEKGKDITNAKKSDKRALLHKSGKELTPFKYDWLETPYYYYDNLIKMKVGDKYGYLDYSGKEVIPAYFEELDTFSEELCAAQSNGKWGYIDKKGNIVIKYKFDVAYPFSEGLALIVYMIQENGPNNWKCIDKTGKMIFAVNGGEPGEKGSFSDGLLLLQDANMKYFFVDKKGVPVSDTRYEFATEYSEGLAGICIDSKCGYIDTTGKVVIPLKYSSPSPFYQGTASVTEISEPGFEKVLIIDKTGKVISTMN